MEVMWVGRWMAVRADAAPVQQFGHRSGEVSPPADAIFPEGAIRVNNFAFHPAPVVLILFAVTSYVT